MTQQPRSSADRAKQAAIRDLYQQVRAPAYAAANLDALTDVLRDLSWLPAGTVRLDLPDLSGLSATDRQALLQVLSQAVTDSADTDSPLQLNAGAT